MCSTLWAWLLAEDWVVVLVCSWPFLVSVGLAFRVFDVVVHSLAEDWVVVLAVAGVDGVFHKHVR